MDQNYPTRFSTKWVLSFTMGKEIEFKNGGALHVGGRLLYNGGYRYTPFDPVRSSMASQYVPLANSFYNFQVSLYSRLDSSISYRYNNKKYSESISLDIQNLTIKKNLNGASYNSELNELNFSRFDGGEIIPVLSFVFDF